MRMNRKTGNAIANSARVCPRPGPAPMAPDPATQGDHGVTVTWRVVIDEPARFETVSWMV